MTQTQEQLLTLFRAIVKGGAIDSADFRGYDWEALFKEAHKQSLVGQIYGMIEMNYEDLNLSLRDKMQWYGHTSRIEQANQSLNQTLCRLVETLNSCAIPSILFKGQGCARFYPKPNYRSPGDIDLYVGPDNFKKAQACLQKSDLRVTWNHIDVKHAEFTCLGNSVELHRYGDFLPQNKRNSVFQRELSSALLQNSAGFHIGDTFIRVLPVDLNAVYVFIHMFRHFLSGGATLRQVYDWLMICRCVDYAKVEGYLRQFGFYDAWCAFARLAVEKFGFPDVGILLGTTPKALPDNDKILEHLFNDCLKQKEHHGGLMRALDAYAGCLSAFDVFPTFCLRYALRAFQSHFEKYVLKEV